MNGAQYEQFVRAVLVKRLELDPADMQSAKASGVSFPGTDEVRHQIDLFYTDRGEVADYLTIIECKYRSADRIDQEEVGKLAFVKASVRASKAILVTNRGFTSGARSVATAENIALLVIDPQVEYREGTPGEDVATLFAAAQALLDRSGSYQMTVVCRVMPDPNERGRDLIAGLLADPAIRAEADRLLSDPAVRQRVAELARNNPDVARKALDFLRGHKW